MKVRRDETGLDHFDRAILRLLQVDSRTSLTKMAKTVRLSATSIMERTRRLESKGYIKGYHACLDASRMGIGVTVFIGVSIDRPGLTDGIKYKLADAKDVLECHRVTGEHSLLLKVKTRNTESLEALIGYLRSIPGVKRTRTNVVLSTSIERVQREI